MNFTIPAPFTAIHLIFDVAFSQGLEAMLGNIQSALAAPMVACVTLWIIIQGILVMRGQIDTRGGITRVILVAIVTALVVRQADYHMYVVSLFEETIPNFIQEFSGSGLALATIPTQLDTMFAMTQVVFQRISAEIGPMNQQDQLSFQGAQWIFYGSLWATFGVYTTVGILTKVLLAIGPIVLSGYLFEKTREMAARWLGQLLTYGLLLLLLNVVATIVIITEAAALAAMLAVISAANTTTAKIIGLYELDMLFLTGNALILALPAIAGNIGGSYWAGGNTPAESLKRRFSVTTRH
ncbi:type IV secretion system protein [Rhizobium skierniewicense]|uniref:type IV secretion system protein n=1 Tax=Rhizobium TaxID=379 RepID=UPI001784F0B7|nr:type IV secretion system protein [Rhizobium sp. CFBP 13644]MBD8694249.1 type IV secretion system protein [Rhizobium sp. CFBP 13717]MCI9868601.1 type IV secretion system protein [Rhizobium skierniewicense]